MEDRDVIEEFRSQLSTGSMAELSVAYRVVGGPPSERIEINVELAGDGELRWQKLDRLQEPTSREGKRSLGQATAKDLLTEVASAFEALVPREEARFPPDSLVGSLTIRLPTGAATRFFLADREARRQTGSQVEEVLSHFESFVGTNGAGGGAP